MSYQFSPEQTEWLEALESGKYEQHIGSLGKIYDNKKSFCCLGVACKIFQNKFNLKIRYDIMDRIIFNNETACLAGELDDLRRLLKLKSGNGKIDEESCLAQMNDAGKSFEEIAAFIRKNPHVVFEG